MATHDRSTTIQNGAGAAAGNTAAGPAGYDANDFARDRVPDDAKRSAAAVMTVLIGFVTAFFFPLVGGMFLMQYGAAATWIGLAIAFVLLTVLALTVARVASREGLTSELLTRGAGFGTVGSALACIIYAGTFIIYAGTEGQILASSIDQLWNLPDGIWYVVVAVIFLPMAWNGISSMTKILAYTIPLYFILLVAAIIIAWNRSGGMPEGMFSALPAGATGGVVGVLGVLAALAGTIGINPFEASDFNRFIRSSEFKRRAAVSVVLPYALLFFVAMPLGIYFTLATGKFSPSIYFVGLLGLIPGVLLAWVSQIRVNLTNLHVSSVSLTSASETAGARRLGRRFWLVVVTVAMIALMSFDVLGNLVVFLEWTGIFLLAWLACIVADLVMVRGWLKIVTGPIEYRGSHLPRYNIVGVTALLTATVAASLIWFLAENPIVNSLSAFIGFAIAFVVHTAMAVVTKGRTYFADSRDPRIAINQRTA